MNSPYIVFILDLFVYESHFIFLRADYEKNESALMHKDYPTLHKYDILLKSFGVQRFFIFCFFLKTKTNRNKQKSNKQTNLMMARRKPKKMTS